MDKNMAIIVSENLLSDLQHQQYLDFITDKRIYWGIRDVDGWEGRVLHYYQYNHIIPNNFLLNTFKNKLKLNFEIKKEIYAEYLAFIKWEVGDKQGIRTDSGGDMYDFRNFTCIYHLNDDYEGGELIFPKLDIGIKPTANTLIFFPINSDYEYGVTPITNGTRHTITSFWTFDKKYDIEVNI